MLDGFEIVNGLAFLYFLFLFSEEIFIVVDLLFVFGEEFFDLVFVEILHDKDGIFLLLCFFEFLLEDFYLVGEDVVLLDGEFPLVL